MNALSLLRNHARHLAPVCFNAKGRQVGSVIKNSFLYRKEGVNKPCVISRFVIKEASPLLEMLWKKLIIGMDVACGNFGQVGFDRKAGVNEVVAGLKILIQRRRSGLFPFLILFGRCLVPFGFCSIGYSFT
jgi:hypothetical protein